MSTIFVYTDVRLNVFKSYCYVLSSHLPRYGSFTYVMQVDSTPVRRASAGPVSEGGRGVEDLVNYHFNHPIVFFMHVRS